MINSNWLVTTQEAFQNLLAGLIEFIPTIVGAIIMLTVGWFISVGIGKLIAKILEKIKFNQFLEKAGWKSTFDKAEIKVDATNFIGAIFKWILFIVFLLAAVDILGLKQFANFLTNILNYLPNVAIATLIFVTTVIIADIAEKIARAGVEGIKIGYSNMVAIIVKWSIWIFAISAILIQLGIASALMLTLFTGIVAFLVIAGGLAFGFGGKDVAAEILRDLQKKIKK